MERDCSIKKLLGLTLASIAGKAGDDEIVFKTVDDRTFKMFHSQDCCENVSVEDIVGDLGDLIGYTITEAEETNETASASDVSESGTWTFYKLGTVKGRVTVRWLGASNGYYSESVDFAELT